MAAAMKRYVPGYRLKQKLQFDRLQGLNIRGLAIVDVALDLLATVARSSAGGSATSRPCRRRRSA